MADRPRAARFDDVDESGADEHIAYLDEQAQRPFWRERKAATIDLLQLRPGSVALDVGCGTGDDVRAMAERAGRAVGVDTSEALIEEARRRAAGHDATFLVADALDLPFADGEFDGVRTERTLQHVEDPSVALREMARILKPGAPVVAIEPDWATLELRAEPASAGAAVARRWADSIRHPRAGHDLPGLMAAAGLTGVETFTHTSEIEDAGFADRQFALRELAEAAADAGDVPREDAERWLAELAAGRLSASVDYVTARGFAPG